MQAIQSRVADLMRRYDESVSDSAAASADDDDEHISVPSQWKVGDVLMAAHISLAKTGSRTERAIIAEFDDDPEVMEALGDGAMNFAKVVEEAAQKTHQMHQMLKRTIAMVKHLQLSDEALRLVASRAAGEQGQQVKDLKTTLEAFQKEKSMVLTQLQDQMKAHKELLIAMDEQNQELKKTQIAIATKTDEMKMVREDFDRRLAEAQHALDTSQRSVSEWRDKFQASVKSQAAADQKATELEKTVQAQAEDIIKHEVVFQAKTQEEKHREKVKDGEIQRLRAEVAAAMQTIADHDERKAVKSANGDQLKASLSKEKQELLGKLQQAESTIQDLKTRLSDESRSKHQFENDNNDLSRLVLEMQERARQYVDTVPLAEPGGPGGALPKKTSSFAISLRAFSIKGDDSGGSKPRSAAAAVNDDDDLSSSSDEDDSETEQEEKALNAAVQQVVTSVFPQYQRVVDQGDEKIDQNIAFFEDLKKTPTDQGDEKPRKQSHSALQSTPAPVPPVPMTEVERMKAACDDELARMKQQYVAGLIEYKRLVIEQYERRQSQIRKHHRTEIENLVMLVQDKFKREIKKHDERMSRAKKSLKLLYRAMRMGGDSPFGRPSSVPSSADEVPETPEQAVSFKSLLRAVVYAMSSSKKRNEVATKQIAEIYETVRRKRETSALGFASRHARRGSASTASAVPGAVVNQTAKSMLTVSDDRPPTRERHSVLSLHVGCQVCEDDFELLNVAKGFRSSSIAPERMDDYVLSSSACFGNRNGADRQQQDARKSRAFCGEGSGAGLVLHLVEGAVFSDEIVAELREMLPSLPAGAYYLSVALKQKLLLELLRFYSVWDARHLSSNSVDLNDRFSSPGPCGKGDFEVVIGSPRDTPFMRRKALESVQKHQMRRRQLLSSGGEAVIQSSSAYPTSNRGNLLPSSPRAHNH